MKWNEEDEQFLLENWLNMTDGNIGLIIGKKGISVFKKRQRMKLFLPPEIARERHSKNALFQTEKRNKQKQKNFPFGTPFNIYSVVYFANIKRLSIRKRSNKKKFQFEEVMIDICDIFEVPFEKACSADRGGYAVFCRQVFCYVAKKMYPKKSHSEIAKFCGYKEHTMSLHAEKAIMNGISSNDPRFLVDWYKYLKNTKIFKK